jgi:hypothetical protein
MARAHIRRWTRRDVRRAFAADSQNADPAALEIDEAGCHFFWPGWTCHLEWRAVRNFISTASLFLVADEHHLFMVPKRAFTTAAAQEDFCRFIRERMERTAKETGSGLPSPRSI